MTSKTNTTDNGSKEDTVAYQTYLFNNTLNILSDRAIRGDTPDYTTSHYSELRGYTEHWSVWVHTNGDVLEIQHGGGLSRERFHEAGSEPADIYYALSRAA